VASAACCRSWGSACPRRNPSSTTRAADAVRIGEQEPRFFPGGPGDDPGDVLSDRDGQILEQVLRDARLLGVLHLDLQRLHDLLRGHLEGRGDEEDLRPGADRGLVLQPNLRHRLRCRLQVVGGKRKREAVPDRVVEDGGVRAVLVADQRGRELLGCPLRHLAHLLGDGRERPEVVVHEVFVREREGVAVLLDAVGVLPFVEPGDRVFGTLFDLRERAVLAVKVVPLQFAEVLHVAVDLAPVLIRRLRDLISCEERPVDDSPEESREIAGGHGLCRTGPGRCARSGSRQDTERFRRSSAGTRDRSRTAPGASG